MLLEMPVFLNSRCEKPSISKFLIQNTQCFDRNPRFSIETLGILIEIQGFSFGTLGILKICDNCIPYQCMHQDKLQLVIYSDRLHDFFCHRHPIYVKSFFSLQSQALQFSLPLECFPVTYDLNSFKCRINRHLLALGSL